MNCNPSIWQITPLNYPKPAPVKVQIDKLMQLAWQCVNETFDINGYYSSSHYHRKVWATGIECLKTKSRIELAAIARGLVFHYLFSVGWKDVEVAAVFNRERTTAIHWRNRIEYLLQTKFDSNEKDAVKLFYSKI